MANKIGETMATPYLAGMVNYAIRDETAKITDIILVYIYLHHQQYRQRQIKNYTFG